MNSIYENKTNMTSIDISNDSNNVPNKFSKMLNMSQKHIEGGEVVVNDADYSNIMAHMNPHVGVSLKDEEGSMIS